MAGGGLLTGLLLGWLIATLFSQRRRHELERAVDRLETQITVQDELARERAEAWSVASQRLSASFAALASESLRTNNEAFPAIGPGAPRGAP